MTETYKVVADVEEMRWFHANILPRCLPNEVHFLSMSARNKKLSEEEREKFQLGRSEMFAKQIVRHDDFDSFLQHVRRFEVNKEAYLTKAGLPFPDKVLVCYVNICPIDMLGAMSDQVKELNDITMALANSAVKGSKGGVQEEMYKVRKSFDTCQSLFARNFGHREWVDVDVDFKESVDGVSFADDHYLKIRNIFEEYLGEHLVYYVKTGGGIHCLVKKAELKIDLKAVCEKLASGEGVKEAVINRNQMMPLPGTFQYGEGVRVLNRVRWGC
jgi:hypothetical protein